MTTTQAKVPLLDPDTGLFPDRFAPASVAADAAAAASSAGVASSAASTATQKAADAEAARVAAVAAKVAAEAVPAQVDAAMASVAADPDSEFAAQQNAIFATPVGAYAPASKVPPSRAPLSMVADLGTAGHGYVASSGAVTSEMNDTTDFARGKQSAWVTTNGAGAVAGIRKQGFTAINMTGKKFEVSVKVSDWLHCRYVQVYMGDSAFTNFYIFTIYDSLDRSSAWIMPGSNDEWITLTFDKTCITSTTGAPDLTQVRALQVAFTDDNTGYPIKGHVNHFATFTGSPLYPNGVVSLTGDDSFLSQWTIMQSKASQYGFQCTFYTIVDILGATMGGVPYYMTLNHLKAMQDVGGHEIAAHAFTTAAHNTEGGYNGLTAEQLDYELRNLKKWMVENGFHGKDSFAYPKGIFNAEVEAAVKKYFSNARGTIRKPYDSARPAHLHRLHSADPGTLAAATAEVDKAYTNGTWLNFRFHDLVAVVPTPAGTTLVQWDIASFNSLIDYIATKGIPVRTVGDVLGTA